ncbi:MAG: hypothetical protein H0X61_12715 [Acidimicrobiia bacterium]|nr:hypothetical protein [Acidimicrobiia bacterium]
MASGDRRALSELYERHRRGLWSFIRRSVADEHLAEEVLADTLVAVWRARTATRVGRWRGRRPRLDRARRCHGAVPSLRPRGR